MNYLPRKRYWQKRPETKVSLPSDSERLGGKLVFFLTLEQDVLKIRNRAFHVLMSWGESNQKGCSRFKLIFTQKRALKRDKDQNTNFRAITEVKYLKFSQCSIWQKLQKRGNIWARISFYRGCLWGSSNMSRRFYISTRTHFLQAG